MDRPNTCMRCGQDFYHAPKWAPGIHTQKLGGGNTNGFCSDACLNAYLDSQKQAKEAKRRAKESERLADAEEKRRQQEKDHEKARKEAKEALEKAKKNVKKWEGIADKLEAAIESDGIKELKDATLEATTWSSTIITLLLLLDIGAVVWYYFFR